MSVSKNKKPKSLKIETSFFFFKSSSPSSLIGKVGSCCFTPGLFASSGYVCTGRVLLNWWASALLAWLLAWISLLSYLGLIACLTLIHISVVLHFLQVQTCLDRACVSTCVGCQHSISFFLVLTIYVASSDDAVRNFWHPVFCCINPELPVLTCSE